MEIEEFARSLKEGQIRAVDEAAEQVALEDAPFWLCQIVDTPFQAEEPHVFAGDHFEAGFYLVKIKWYKFVRLDSADQRCYELLNEVRMLSVNCFIRCEVVKFAVVPARGRPAANPLAVLSAIECGRIMQSALIKDF